MSPPPDLGLQRERTTLAWRRTSLAVIVNAILVIRAGAHSEQSLMVTLGATLLVAGLAVGAGGAWRSRALLTQQAVAAAPVALTFALTGLAVLTGIAGAVAIVCG